MKYRSGLDILIHVAVPVVAGCTVYFLTTVTKFPALITNHLADGLWAYAFMSTILIIWGRRIKISWILIVFITAITFEVLQYFHAIAGTGDVYDIITYFLFFIIALVTNPLLKTNF